jgi:hypothetical protein
MRIMMAASVIAVMLGMGAQEVPKNAAPPPLAKGEGTVSKLKAQKEAEAATQVGSEDRPVSPCDKCSNCRPEIQPVSKSKEEQARADSLDALYRRYLWATIVGVAGALLGIAIFIMQTVLFRRSAIAARDAAKSADKSAQAYMNSERAWVIAELIPICREYGGQWHRPSGTGGLVALSKDEIIRGYHLMHNLKMTNMGRTPATILKFSIGHSYMEKDGTDSPTGNVVQGIERPEFDQILGGGASTDVMEVNIKRLRDSLIKEDGDSKKPIIFHGSVEYQHVFSEVEVIVVRFRYLYVPSTARLERMSTSKTDKTKQ